MVPRRPVLLLLFYSENDFFSSRAAGDYRHHARNGRLTGRPSLRTTVTYRRRARAPEPRRGSDPCRSLLENETTATRRPDGTTSGGTAIPRTEWEDDVWVPAANGGASRSTIRDGGGWTIVGDVHARREILFDPLICSRQF